MSSRWPLRIAAGALALGGAIGAGYLALAADADAGIPVPSSPPAHISVPAASRVVAQVDEGGGPAAEGSGSDCGVPTPTDAGIDSPADLPPEVPDAGADVHFDAGQPLRR